MDFRSLLQSFTTLSEGETKDTKTGRVHKGSYGTSYDGDEDDDGKKKEKASGEKRGRGRPKKGADETGEVKKYDSSALSSAFGGGKKPKKEIGKVSKKHSLKEYIEDAETSLQEGMTSQDQIQIKPASQTNTQVIQQGNKTLGTVNNPQLANQIKQSIGKGEMSLNPDGQEMAEDGGEKWIKGAIKHPGAFTKKAKAAHMGTQAFAKKHAHDSGTLGKQARLAQTLNKMHESKDELADKDYDEDGKRETSSQEHKGAVTKAINKALDKDSKKKVSESIILEGAMKDLMMRLIDDLNAGGQGYNIKPAVDLQDRQLATRVIDKTLAHDDRYRRLSHSLKSQLRDAALEEFGFTDFESSLEEADTLPAVSSKVAHTQHGLDAKPSKFVAVNPNPPKTPWKVDPIERSTQEIGAGARKAFDFIRGTQKESTFEGKDMKDIQLEGWEKQLNSLLTEGITVSSSTGQEGSPDSVTISATDADAGQLLGVLRNAGIGVFGGDAKPEIGYGVAQGGEEDFDGTGTEPQPSPNVVGDDGDMLSMMKKMAGIETGGEEGGQDYEDEEGSEEQTLEPADSGEEEGSEEQDSAKDPEEEKEETDEGNAFGQEVRQKKSDNIPDSQQRIKTGGKDLPVKEGGFDPEQGDGGGAGAGDITKESHENCNECGYTMESCECDHEQVNEFANDAGGDAMGDTQLAQLKALLSMGNDMHEMKRDQTVGNPTQVSMAESLAQWKKLSGIK